MLDIKKYQQNSPARSKQYLEKIDETVYSNLAEMSLIVNRVSGDRELLACADKHRLLYYASYLYDFYLLTEDCLLHIARATDKWIPGSLDWRSRLIKLMQSPVSGTRPPVLSAESAYLLADYLNLFLNFHHHCSTLSPSRIIKMIDNIDHLYRLLEKELPVANKRSLPGR
jgi:hypothetical protein